MTAIGSSASPVSKQCRATRPRRPNRARRPFPMKRVFNFSPGPAMLPEPVLRRAQAEMLDWRGSGMSVMEVSHRGTDFIEFAAQSERTLRELLSVPANYKVLFLQGG